MDESAINARELLDAADSGLIGIPVEIGAYLVLLTVEALAQRSLAFQSDEISLRPEGGLSIDSTREASEEEATRSATELLKEILLAASGASPGALIAWLERAESGAPLSLKEMHDIVEASLVPLNREASERALSRFIRKSIERLRASAASGSASGDVNEDAIDQELDALLRRAPEVIEDDRPHRDPAAYRQPPPPAKGPGLALSALVLFAAAALGLYLSRPELFDGLFK